MDTTARKTKQTARETTERAEATAIQATEGLRECQAAVLVATQASINAMFEYMQEAFGAKSLPELMELSTKHAQRQMQMMTEQAREVADAMQKAIADSTRSFTNMRDTFGRSS